MADSDIVKEARDALDLSFQHDRSNREEANADLSFVAGYQWSDAEREERAGRPTITINRSGQFIRQVANPIRQNMPTIKVEPDSDDNSDMAELADGLIRRIQYNSSAAHVYANAVEHMVACGIGWWRVATDYLSDDSFDQEILIKRIFNPMSVYPDPSSREPDRSDMNWCLVSEMWPLEAFKKKWPGKSTEGFEVPSAGGSQTRAMGWSQNNSVRVAEYWRRKPAKKTLAQLKDGRAVEITDKGRDQLKMLQEMGIVVNVRDVDGYTVEMNLVSGNEILEEPVDFPSKWIPLIPVIGAEVPLERGVYRHGLIRFQREPQHLHNYFMSVAAEALGQQPKSPYTVVASSIKNYKSVWDNANRVPTPYLPYDADPNLPNGGKPDRVAPPPLPAGLIQMAQMLAEDMKATTGIYDAALGAKSNETSGVAIGQRVQQGDQATFHFVDNLEHGLEHLGRVLLDMIPKVYDTARTIKIKGNSAKEKAVKINQPVMSYGGEEMTHNDVSKMSFNSVRVILGQNFASRKQQTSQTLIALTQSNPAIWGVAGDIIAKNLDIDEAEELSERMRVTLVPPVQQMLQSQQTDGQPGQPPPGPPQPSPEEQAQQQQQQAHEQAMQLEQQAGQFKVQQEQAKAQSAQQAVRTEEFKSAKAEADYHLALKKLSEPPPTPRSEANAGT